MKPSISDSDLDNILHANGADEFSGTLHQEISRYQFTPEQITILCEHVVTFDSVFSVASLPLSPSDIDMLIHNCYSGDRMALVTYCNSLTPEHIARLLDDVHREVRREAYKHPLCTDAMKVAYHLKWGGHEKNF